MTDVSPSMHTDIRPHGWIGRLPPRARAYVLLARLDRPVGTWLLFLPGLCGILVPEGTAWNERVWLGVLFVVGAFAMRSAGCIINDLWDRKIDAKVARTAGRPLASGALRPRDALTFLSLWLILSLLVLLLLRPATWAMAPIGLVLTALYPLAKRVTWWPQLVMGMTFGFSAPMGVVAASAGPVVFGPMLALYAGVICWQLGYDTIYGFQDMEDDARIGVKSTSRLMEKHARFFIAVCYTGSVVAWGVTGVLADFTIWFWPMLAVVALMLGRQVARLNPHDGPRNLALFRANVPCGWILAAAFVVGRLL